MTVFSIVAFVFGMKYGEYRIGSRHGASASPPLQEWENVNRPPNPMHGRAVKAATEERAARAESLPSRAADIDDSELVEELRGRSGRPRMATPAPGN
jgi:hypothetical protein